MFKAIHTKFFAGYLQVLLMAGALQRRIIQYCDAPGMDLYNTEVIPIDIPPNVTPIRILWCSLVNSVKNHIVPLRKLSCKLGIQNKIQGEAKWWTQPRISERVHKSLSTRGDELPWKPIRLYHGWKRARKFELLEIALNFAKRLRL